MKKESRVRSSTTLGGTYKAISLVAFVLLHRQNARSNTNPEWSIMVFDYSKEERERELRIKSEAKLNHKNMILQMRL